MYCHGRSALALFRSSFPVLFSLFLCYLSLFSIILFGLPLLSCLYSCNIIPLVSISPLLSSTLPSFSPISYFSTIGPGPINPSSITRRYFALVTPVYQGRKARFAAGSVSTGPPDPRSNSRRRLSRLSKHSSRLQQLIKKENLLQINHYNGLSSVRGGMCPTTFTAGFDDYDV